MKFCIAPLRMSNTLRNRTAYALLACAALLAYGNSFFGVFQFDDYRAIVNSPSSISWSAWLNELGQGLRPLLKLSYLLNAALSEGVFGFHLFNLLVHTGNALLVYQLALHWGAAQDKTRDWRNAALFGALLFAVHPLHSEAVTYISGRSMSLMTFFYLAALLVYARGQTSGSSSLRWLSVSLFILAMLTKESAVLFPLTLLLWEWSCRTPWRTMGRRLWPFGMLFVLAVCVLLLHPGYSNLMWDSVQTRSWHDSLLTQSYVSVAQSGKLLWPFALNIDPDWAVIKSISAVWPQLILIGTAGLCAAWFYRSRPWWSWGLMWLLLHAFLLNAFFPRADIANERQLYWASWPLLLALAIELERFFTRRVFLGLTGALLVVLMVATQQRNTVYHSEIALWQDTAGKSPNKARVWNNLGYAYQAAGRTDDAVAAYCMAIKLNPDHVKAHNNLSRLGAACP